MCKWPRQWSSVTEGSRGMRWAVGTSLTLGGREAGGFWKMPPEMVKDVKVEKAWEKAWGWPAGYGEGNLLLDSLEECKPFSDHSGEEAVPTLLCHWFFKGHPSRICGWWPVKTLAPQREPGGFSPPPFPREPQITAASVPLSQPVTEVQIWPGQRGNFRGKFVYLKPHTGSWAQFLCEDFVFCI